MNPPTFEVGFANVASTPALIGLPPELQNAIAGYISRPSDLNSLCLTCKQLKDVALPFLYHTIVLDSDAWDCSSAFFEFNHPGHPHVRRLFIRDPVRDEEPTPMSDSVNTTIRCALQYLPRDMLKELRTPETRRIEEETLVCLHRNQTKIEVLDIGFCRTHSESIRLACRETLKSVRVLITPPSISTSDGFDIYRDILASRSQMDMLFIENCRLVGGWEGDSELKSLGNDRAKLTEFTLSKLFGGVKTKSKARTHLQIHELWLHGLSLDVTHQLLSKKIDFLHVRTLALVQCAASKSFIRSLTKLFKKSNTSLQAFHLVDQEGEMTRAVAKDLENFFQSFSGLVHLYLHIRGATKGLDMKCFVNHSNSLKHLGFRARTKRDFDGEDHWGVSVDQAKAISSAFPLIEELMIYLPEVSVSGLGQSESNDATEIMTILSALTTLETLHIVNWPIALSAGTDDADERTTQLYLHDIDRFATDVVQRLGKNLHILCIGDPDEMEDVASTEDGHILPGHFDRAFFVTGTQTDRYGRVKPVAIRTDGMSLRFEEPGFDGVRRSSPVDDGLSGGGYYRLRE